MTRYLSQLDPIAARLRAEENAVALVIVPETQQALVAELLSQLLARPNVTLDALGDVRAGDVVNCVVTLGSGSATSALSSINSRRHWITDRGSLVFVISRNELQAVQHHAADITSVAHLAGQLSYEPTADQHSEADARGQLAAHYRIRFGAVDLRGFIRSESEDVSFPLESVFQPLQGTRSTPSDPITATALPDLLQDQRGPAMLVGPPGCGKSFFLRWYALTGSSAQAFLGIERPVPLHVSLAAFSSAPASPTLREFLVDVLLQEHLGMVDHLTELDAAGRLVFLLDGLDEAGDAGARSRVASAVDVLEREFPRARIIATSRRPGLEGIERIMDEISIEPLAEDGIRALLTTWCALYERHRAGTPAAEARGRVEGAALAATVLRSSSLRELASTPLLATIIAIVHRAGVQVPEHRAELYDHIAKILVERWNQVRSATVRPGAALRVADAIRLLGPVALELIDSDSEGAVSEERLHAMLQRALAAGAVRGIASAEEALDMFRSSLGLLVERAPGMYGFLHQTLLEFFGAQELVRTSRLEDLCRNPDEVFLPKWREVLLLASGILGQLQANDPRLEQMVRSLVRSAEQLRTHPSAAVPSLLAGLVADDSSLTSELAMALLDELVPKWWFAAQYSPPSLRHVVLDALYLEHRIRQGRWADLFGQRLALVPASLDVAALLGPLRMFGSILDILHGAGVEIGAALRDAAIAAVQGRVVAAGSVWILSSRSMSAGPDGRTMATFSTTPGVARLLQDPDLQPLWRIIVTTGRGVVWEELQWFAVQGVSEDTHGQVALELLIPLRLPDNDRMQPRAIESFDTPAPYPSVAKLLFVPARAKTSMTAALKRAC